MTRALGSLVVLSMAAVLAAGLLLGRAATAQPAPITRIELLDIQPKGLQGKEAHLYTIELAPGVESPRHWHPGDYFLYVLEGSGLLMEDGKAPMALRPGTPYYVYSAAGAPAYWHWEKNTSTTQPLKMVVVLVGDRGEPITRFEK